MRLTEHSKGVSASLLRVEECACADPGEPRSRGDVRTPLDPLGTSAAVSSDRCDETHELAIPAFAVLAVAVCCVAVAVCCVLFGDLVLIVFCLESSGLMKSYS